MRCGIGLLGRPASESGCLCYPTVAHAPGDHAIMSPTLWTWAQLMRRTFDLDVLACPRCDGRLGLIATILDPGMIRAILRSRG